MGQLMRDVRFALRMLMRSPGFTAIAVLTLALGIGANTAIFSVVDAVLLKPLPYSDPSRLTTIWGTSEMLRETSRALSYPDVEDIRRQATSFEHVAAFDYGAVTLTGQRDIPAEHIQSAAVTTDMLTVLGVHPMLGRDFAPGEDAPGHLVALLSWRLWTGRFGGDPRIVGKTLTLDGEDYTVIGVMPQGFRFPMDTYQAELWTTFSSRNTPVNKEQPVTSNRGAHFIAAIARLGPGVTQEQANQETIAFGKRLAKEYPDSNARLGLRSESALDGLVGPLRAQLWILLGAVGLVLLIACANVANLLLARATGRQREMAVRAAMGATRGRILQQLLVESGMLSLAGGIPGLLVAQWGVALLVSLAAKDMPRIAGTTLDVGVLAYTLGISLVTGVLFGIAPAWQLSRQELVETLKAGARGAGSGERRTRLRGLVVVSEMTLAVILLAGAGLLLQSLWRLTHANTGFDPHGVLTVSVNLPDMRYQQAEKVNTFYRQLLDRVRAVPGVTQASGVFPLPLSEDRIRTDFEIIGRPTSKGEEPLAYDFGVAPGYFESMRIPLLAGRTFQEEDNLASAPVVIVNQALADKYFPGENAVGKHIHAGIRGDAPDRGPQEIVGVVGNVQGTSLGSAPFAQVYLPHAQMAFNLMSLTVRTSLTPASLTSAIAEQVQALDKDIPVYGVHAMDEYISDAAAQPRIDSTLLALFAGLALVLALVGISSVISYNVGQRTNEIGIRMALGAGRGDVFRLIMGQGVRLAGIGIGCGLVGALITTRVLQSLLFGVKATDPMTFAVVAAGLFASALGACYLPARRALNLDPMVALRHE